MSGVLDELENMFLIGRRSDPLDQIEPAQIVVRNFEGMNLRTSLGVIRLRKNHEGGIMCFCVNIVNFVNVF